MHQANKARPGNSALSEVLLIMRTSLTMCFAHITSSRRAILMTINRKPKQFAGKIKEKFAGTFPPERLEALARQSHFVQRTRPKPSEGRFFGQVQSFYGKNRRKIYLSCRQGCIT